MINKTDIKILLVDDFEMIRQVLRQILTELGFTNIVEAENGFEAMEKLIAAHISKESFDLVFCDWNMPELTGIEVLKALRETPEFVKLPFIMVTAECDQHAVIRALKTGATDYIVKPIAPDILARKVEKILSTLCKKAA